MIRNKNHRENLNEKKNTIKAKGSYPAPADQKQNNFMYYVNK